MVFKVNQKEYKKRELLIAPFMTFDDMYHTKIYRIKQGMELKEIEKMEDYLIAKNKSYAVFGITRNEIKKELLLSEEEAEKLADFKGKIIIRADKESNYESVVSVIDALNKKGVKNFVLAAVKN
jgi:biopolymer transport protein ExbD